MNSSQAITSAATEGHVARPRRSLPRSAAVGVARGFVGGLLATAAMSGVMLVAQKVGLLGQMPPKKISDRLLAVAGVRRRTPEPARKAFAVLSHFAFGGTTGAVFGLAHEVWRTRARSTSGVRGHRAPILGGIAYGTAIWAVSYAGWVPALRIMAAPQNDRRGRPTSMVLAHWVFGAALAKAVA